jgi:RNA polymerase sigma-70 factor (ECF subfamily)
MTSKQLGSIYRDNHQWLLGWLLSKVGCSHRAADLAQDTFVRLLQTQQLQPELELQQPRAYLRTVANGLVVDHFRKRSLEQAYQEALATLPEAMEISVEDRLLLRETLDQLDSLLSQLPERVRHVFLLSQLDGLSYAQIADQVGVSLRTVKRDMQQAVIHCLTLSWSWP